MAELAAYEGPVVVLARRASAVPEAWEWLQALVAVRPDTLVVELGWPSPEVEALPRVVRGWGASLAPSRAVGAAIVRAGGTPVPAPTGEER
jgi:hypothetical protein